MTAQCRCLASFLLGATLLLAGCAKDTPSSAAAPRPAPPEPEAPAPATFTRGKGVMDVRSREPVRNDLRQMGLAIIADYAGTGKGPAKVEDLQESLKEVPKGYQALKNGQLVLVPNAALTSNSILIYERDTETDGTRLVLKGDGSVAMMRAAEFQAALKNQGQ
jgi:hypothetical protein